jgi:hypothetical protein
MEKKNYITTMEYEQVRKKNILLRIYLFSSEMKRRRTTHRERESNIISLPPSLSPSFFHQQRRQKRKGRRRDSTDEQLVTNYSRWEQKKIIYDGYKFACHVK